MVDLHLHTTASDGRLTPLELVAAAAAAGVTVMAVTDHDTIAACADVRDEAQRRGIETITGIEITAVENNRDVHMLGYFLDTADRELAAFLDRQRAIRRARLEHIGERLAELAMPIDTAQIVAASAGRSIGRPQVADAMIAAGYVADRREAFDRWLGSDRPAFVPRTGAAPEQVIATVHRAGGLMSLAHPGRTKLPDPRLERLAAAGLDALEVYHSDHDDALIAHYASLADRLGLLRTGGSDFHGDPSHGVSIGGSTLPPEYWTRLHAAAR
ncbi:MAG TPA: PHP domain-containing protein [Vicinamibacterales bacterium]|jgi:predicted metal-dependent phosphoesterase TrpH|nr:PHP domain-containing protein [Vicinamibacterales bacterium]